MYHVHVYYTSDSKALAETIHRKILKDELPIERLGFMQNEPIGPHPQAMFQMQLIDCYLMDILEWLDRHRQNLSVLAHPVCENELKAHTEEAIWLGEALPLRLDYLPS